MPAIDVPRDHYELVVAHYREDLSWIRDRGLEANATIYSKNPTPPLGAIALPNIGRDYHTYAHHLHERYHTLATRTSFVQGNPFEHALVPFQEQANAKEPFQAVCNAPLPRGQDHVWWSDPQYCSTGGAHLRPDRLEWTIRADDLVEVAKHYFQVALPPVLHYAWGAQFCVSRDCVQRRPYSYYHDLMLLTLCPQLYLKTRAYSNYEIGIMFELLWPLVFSA